MLRLWDKEACPPEEVTFLTLGYCDTECFAFLRSDSESSLAATFAAACVGKQAKGNNKMVDGQSFNALAQAILDHGEDEDVDDGENDSTVRKDSVHKMKQVLSAFRPQIMYAEGQGANCDALVDTLYFYHRSAVGGIFLFKQW